MPPKKQYTVPKKTYMSPRGGARACQRLHQRVRITHLWHRHKILITSQDHMWKQKKTTKAPSRQAKHIYRSPYLCCPSNCRCVPYFLASNTVQGPTRTAENKNANMCISLIECEQYACKHRLFICSKSSSASFHRDRFQRQKANTLSKLWSFGDLRQSNVCEHTRLSWILDYATIHHHTVCAINHSRGTQNICVDHSRMWSAVGFHVYTMNISQTDN